MGATTMMISRILGYKKRIFSLRGDVEYSPDLSLEKVDNLLWLDEKAPMTDEEFHDAAEELIKYNAIKDYEHCIQVLIDRTAQNKGYKDSADFVTYLSSTVSKWKSDAVKFNEWRDDVWQYAVSVMEKVKSGNMDMPTKDEFIQGAPRL